MLLDGREFVCAVVLVLAFESGENWLLVDTPAGVCVCGFIMEFPYRASNCERLAGAVSVCSDLDLRLLLECIS